MLLMHSMPSNPPIGFWGKSNIFLHCHLDINLAVFHAQSAIASCHILGRCLCLLSPKEIHLLHYVCTKDLVKSATML